MKKNQHGFSSFEVLVLIVIIGIVGFVGMYIWQRNNTTKTPQTQKTQEQTEAKASRPFTYTLPSNWGEMTCQDVTLIYPNDDKATDCNDRTNLINAAQNPNELTEPAHCLSSQEIENIKKEKPLLSYDCSTLTVNGKQVIKEIMDQGPDEVSSDVKSVNYEFVQDNKPVTFCYNSTADGTLVHADIAEQIVKTVKLN